ncbi:MAG: UDP-glucose/GDP-mannose dehydrogenase family protein [Chloroflexi bacterium]|nr:UDP-glucose/GDP-mannose dehydrogenase family protein [Ardenticatenaceae bacterium]MBL1130093.1 UDP-glucose/GDP-mannose dehydrogenase family protein [Chloroflexota bacterium]NOG36179.1 UDP-glucose/GDP-mannose dehydrogenase family protein [Chloroflexota bacterium]GIK54870.1 MAG: UDP-glucose dehydrogenase [Chloroflexota bacterium]
MKIIVVGTGFVGLPHAAILAEAGHEVYAYDIDPKKIAAYESGDRAQIEYYVNEPGLYEAIQETHGRYLFFTSNISQVIDETDVLFMCINTPPNRDGSTDLSYYLKAANDVGELLANRPTKNRVVLVNKSTVPIGTARLLERVLAEHGVENFGVASNPEFLAQGNAIDGSRRPDRVVIGADTPEDFQILRRVYSQFVNHVRIKYVETTPETAEAIKYMGNTLLLTYISFWNGVGARVAENLPNVRMEDLKIGVTADGRISTWGSYVSNGAGGSCFGKDIQSLIYQLNQAGCSTDLLQAVYNINEYQKTYLVDRAVHEARFNFNQKTVALLGLAFKKRTNDMRDSAALKAVESLLSKGVKEIRAYDPLAMQAAQEYWFNPEKNHLFERITYHETVQDALKGSDAVFISTDWEEFRGLSRTIEKAVQPPYLVIDGRRMIPDYMTLVDKGYDVLAVGGPLLRKETAAAPSPNGLSPQAVPQKA